MPATTAEPEGLASRRGVRRAVAAGVVVLLAGLLVVLSVPAPRLAGTNDRPLDGGVVVAPGGSFCQSAELLPSGAAALVLAASTAGRPGPPLEARVLSGERELTRGVSPGGYVDGAARVELRSPRGEGTERRGVRVCVANRGRVGVAFLGSRAVERERPATVRGFDQRDPIRARLDWYRSGTASWWSLAPRISERFFLQKASFFGPWTFWAALALLGAVSAAAVAFVLRAPGRRALWACVALAVVNSATWAVVTPSFQVIDEVVHSGYVQYVAESGRLPRPVFLAPGVFAASREEEEAIRGVPFSLQGRPSWSRANHERVQALLDTPLERERESGAGTAANNPPLYYLAEVPAYAAAARGSYFDRLLAMRWLSTLFIGAAVAFVFLFLRELLPGTPWAWATGALAVAFHPVFAWLGGGVNPDSLLWAAGSAGLWLLARAFRRGLDVRHGAGIGVALSVALLTKAAALGLVPGVGIGLVLLVLRARGERRTALLGALAATALVVGSSVGWLVLSREAVGVTAQPVAVAQAQGTGNVREQLVYLWQFYLPRLPFMKDEFVGYPAYPLWQTYFQGFVGRFGYFQYGFPSWVNWLALICAVPFTALVGLALRRRRDAVARRWPEFLCYGSLLVGTLLLIAIAGFRFRAGSGLNFEQPRYVFPLIALYGGLVALAAKGAGRYGPAVGALLVVVAVGHNAFAVLLTIARYYA